MDYRIKPLGKTCEATGEPLAPGALVYSVLVERDGETVRLDYSQEGWTGPLADAIGQWRSVVPKPENDKPKPIDTDALFDHFQQIQEDANPAQQQICYVIALHLLQKRRLSLEGSRIDGDVAYLQLLGARGEGAFEVRDQQLTAEEISTLQFHLTQQLKDAA